jgi:hypothetical protein
MPKNSYICEISAIKKWQIEPAQKNKKGRIGFCPTNS